MRSRGQRLRSILRSRRELARLNHVFIPEKKPDRDRMRRRFSWRVIAPFFALHGALSRDGRALFLFTILIGFAGVDILSSSVHELFAMLCGVMMASLLVRPFYRARGLSLHVETASRVEVGAALQLVVHLANRSDRALTAIRVSGPFLPWDGKWKTSDGGVGSIAARSNATVVAEASFIARGEHHLDAFDAGVLVPMGIAIGPRRRSDGVRFLVVPKVAKVDSLRLVHRRPDLAGDVIAVKAHGETDIDGVRPYRAGDPLKHLHARTWARTGEPHVRTYSTEQSALVGLAVIVDGDDASTNAKEAALSLAAGVAAKLATDQGIDRLLIGEKQYRLQPRRGRAAVDSVLDRLAVLELGTGEESDETIREAALRLSAMVVVTPDDTARRRDLIEKIENTGLPVTWLSVEDTAEEGSALAPRLSNDPRHTRFPIAHFASEDG